MLHRLWCQKPFGACWHLWRLRGALPTSLDGLQATIETWFSKDCDHAQQQPKPRASEEMLELLVIKGALFALKSVNVRKER